MKKLLTLIVCVSLLSCGNYDDSFGQLKNAKIVVIDSCEYIQFHTYGNEAITHKGNCKFCVKRKK